MAVNTVNVVHPDLTAVFPVHVPFRGAIPGGLHDGKLIEIRGHVPYGADAFEINLLTGLDPSSDRPLHISVRFNGRVVVRNSLHNGSWGPEERHGLFPFSSGRDFTLLILAEPVAYRISVNNQHCWEFAHRIPYNRVSSIFISGSVQIEKLEFIDKISPYQRPGPFMPPSSYPGSSGICTVPYPSPGTCMPPNPDRHRGYLIPGVQPAVVSPSYIVTPPEQQIGICPMPSSGLQPSSTLSPVFNPSIPYAYPVYGGLKPGMMIYISGRPSASAHRFTINVQSGTAPYPPPDIAFHFDARFYNFTVIRNTRTNNIWASEEKSISHFPFQPAVNFDMIIRVENDRYMVALNGQHFLEFRHRLTPLSRFDTLYIENDIIVSSIRFA